MPIDVNVSFGSWPFQIFPQKTLPQLASMLVQEGIQSSLVSHIGAVLYPDTDFYNRQLLEEVNGLPEVIPVMVINPTLPGWQKALNDYVGQNRLKAVKIYPNYHCYSLKSGAVNRLVRYLQGKNIRLLIQMRIEDERNQYSRMRVPGVPVDRVIDLHRRFPDFSFVCLNTYHKEARRLGQETSNVLVDIAFTERLETVVTLLRHIPPERILFGSHSPFFYTRSAVLKLDKSEIPTQTKSMIAEENARRFFGL